MKKTISIEGMSCKHCVMHVKNELEEIPGVKILKVEIGSAELEFENPVEDSVLTEAVEEAGYEVKSIK